jgi:hypothetical protein
MKCQRRLGVATTLSLLALASTLPAQDALDLHPGETLRVVHTCEAIDHALSCGPTHQTQGTLRSVDADTLVIDADQQMHMLPLTNVSRIDRLTGPHQDRWEKVWPLRKVAPLPPAPLAARYRVAYCDPGSPHEVAVGAVAAST